jgi:hypothetical protein
VDNDGTRETQNDLHDLRDDGGAIPASILRQTNGGLPGS